MDKTFTIDIFKLRDEPKELEFDVEPGRLFLKDEQFSFPGRVVGHLRLKMIDHDIEGRGEVRVPAETPCARCLDPVRVDVDVTLWEIWLHRDDKAGADRELTHLTEADTQIYTGDQLDIRETLREKIMGELPHLTHCRPDCKGMCSGCGANLNREACECAEDEANEGRAPGGGGPQDDAESREPEWKRKLRALKEQP